MEWLETWKADKKNRFQVLPVAGWSVGPQMALPVTSMAKNKRPSILLDPFIVIIVLYHLEDI